MYETCKTASAPSYRRKYSKDAKAMGRAMYQMLVNGPLDKSAAVRISTLTVEEARDACSYCRTLVERDIRLLVYSYDTNADPADAEDVATLEEAEEAGTDV